jgi:hypothetical protein
MAAKVAEANERVYELILRDEDFYRQLIEPERGGELTRLTVPTR